MRIGSSTNPIMKPIVYPKMPHLRPIHMHVKTGIVNKKAKGKSNIEKRYLKKRQIHSVQSYKAGYMGFFLIDLKM